MVERSPLLRIVSHLVMVLGVLIVGFPLYLAFIASTHTAQEILQVPMPLTPGSNFWNTYQTALFGGGGGPGSGAPVARMMWVSFVTAIVITVGKIAISLLSAFAIVYFRFPFKGLCFWLIFITLMLPVEVRIGPTYEVVSNLGMLNSYAGLTIPLIASATATFLFRQFFLTVPDELVEAARVDGAGPMRFFKDILVPLSRTLQRHWPGVELHWIIDKGGYRLLEGLENVHFHTYDKKTGLAGMRALRHELPAGKFDALLQMQVAFRANVLSAFVPAHRRIGYDRARSKDLHGLFVNERIPLLTAFSHLIMVLGV